MCRGKICSLREVCVAYAPQRSGPMKILRHTFCQKVFTKKLNRVNCWSTLPARNRRDGFSACVYKTALSGHILWLKETRRQRSEEQRVIVLVFTLGRNRDARP